MFCVEFLSVRKDSRGEGQDKGLEERRGEVRRGEKNRGEESRGEEWRGEERRGDEWERIVSIHAVMSS